MIPLAAHPAMKPPVALLVYASDAPARAVYYPFAVFSPEWQALRFACQQYIPVRFMDLPMAVHLAQEAPAEDSTDAETPDSPPADQAAPGTPRLQQNPLLYLAQAAGYDDGERWWEQMVEEHRDGTTLFEAIAEAMTALRQSLGEEVYQHDAATRQRERQREAAMRRAIRTAERDGHTCIAVVCGAWHVPALLERSAIAEDAALLKNLPQINMASTWIPWTHGRLQSASGYGAGVRAPGWYRHLWGRPTHVSVR